MFGRFDAMAGCVTSQHRGVPAEAWLLLSSSAEGPQARPSPPRPHTHCIPARSEGASHCRRRASMRSACAARCTPCTFHARLPLARPASVVYPSVCGRGQAGLRGGHTRRFEDVAVLVRVGGAPPFCACGLRVTSSVESMSFERATSRGDTAESGAPSCLDAPPLRGFRFGAVASLSCVRLPGGSLRDGKETRVLPARRRQVGSLGLLYPCPLAGMRVQCRVYCVVIAWPLVFPVPYDRRHGCPKRRKTFPSLDAIAAGLMADLRRPEPVACQGFAAPSGCGTPLRRRRRWASLEPGPQQAGRTGSRDSPQADSLVLWNYGAAIVVRARVGLASGPP